VKKTYDLTEEDTKTIRNAMAQKENKKFYKRLLAVVLRGEGKSNKEVSEITGYHKKRVGQLVSIYRNEGLAVLAIDGRKGGNHRNMTEAEASEFLGEFKAEAEKGKIPTVNEIAIAYDKATGKERKSKSTVYSFLHTQGWRLVVPQKQHPQKASEAEIEASKKLKSNMKENCQNIQTTPA